MHVAEWSVRSIGEVVMRAVDNRDRVARAPKFIAGQLGSGVYAVEGMAEPARRVDCG